jgi:hypothetical protein
LRIWARSTTTTMTCDAVSVPSSILPHQAWRECWIPHSGGATPALAPPTIWVVHAEKCKNIWFLCNTGFRRVHVVTRVEKHRQVQFQKRSSKQGWKKNPFTLIMTMVSILCARRVTRSFDLTSSICSKFENLHPSLLTEKLLFGQNSPPRRSPTARRCLMGRDAPEAKKYFLRVEFIFYVGRVLTVRTNHIQKSVCL